MMKKLASIGLRRDDLSLEWPAKDRWWRIGTLLWDGNPDPGLGKVVAWLHAMPCSGAVLIARTEEPDAPYVQGTLAVTCGGDEQYSQKCGRIETNYDQMNSGVTKYTIRFFCIPVMAEKDRSGIHFRIESDDDDQIPERKSDGKA